MDHVMASLNFATLPFATLLVLSTGTTTAVSG